MRQKVKKSRKKPVIEGIVYCDQCPFLGMDMNNNWICNPNDYNFGKVKAPIPVPDWCGNKKEV